MYFLSREDCTEGHSPYYTGSNFYFIYTYIEVEHSVLKSRSSRKKNSQKAYEHRPFTKLTY